MKRTVIRAILSAVVLALSTSLALAVEVTVTTPDVTGAAKSSVESTRASAKKTAAGAKATVTDTKAGAKAAVADTTAKTRAAAASVKQTIVDINSATEAELRAIPGVGEAYAAKIIAGRPYANKSQLKTRNILPTPVYETVKNQLVAKKAAKGTAPAKKK
jgi:DNA uptake protein ComE-like DNA-binding protein